MTTLVVASYNAFDKGRPPAADIVAIQERPPKRVIRAALPNHKIIYPLRSSLAIAYNPRVVTNPKVRLTRIHGGRRKVTPSRYILELRCLVEQFKVAAEDTHLVNDPYGPVTRGERPFRRAMWLRGWDMLTHRGDILQDQGYAVFAVGDFNRRDEHWPDAPQSVGRGYDRIFYPAGAEFVNARRGDRAGSDHAPIIASFRLN